MAAPDKNDAETPSEATAGAEAPKGGSPLLPVILVVLLVPTLCYAVMDFLIIPKLRGSLEAAAEKSTSSGHGGKAKAGTNAGGEHGKQGEFTADFGPTVVNLAGTGNSRYLRVNFVVASPDPKIAEIVKTNMSALRDATLSVLSSQSMPLLEGPGGRNSVRNDLIAQFNRTLGGEVIQQIYFSEFVVQ